MTTLSDRAAGKIIFAIFSLYPIGAAMYAYFRYAPQLSVPAPGTFGVGGIVFGAILILFSILPSLVITITQAIYCIRAKRRGSPISYYVVFTMIAATPLLTFLAYFAYFSLTYSQV